ncbi:MAG: phosphatase PAP2 family protein [Alphaproteobacteria bacterium]|nr:phosphatase PAP2 family protein [Alphaproteobacteria bacterium]
MHDAILQWNAIALDLVRRDYTFSDDAGRDESDADPPRTALLPEQPGSPRSARALAMVHLAMYDAWRAYEPPLGHAYLDTPPPPARSSPAAAVAGAAATVLRALYRHSSRHLDIQATHWQLILIAGGEAPAAVAAGFDFGARIGEAMVSARAGDLASAADVVAMRPTGPGTHRPDPFAPEQGLHGEKWGRVPPFGFDDLAPLAARFIPPLDAPGIGAFLTRPEWPGELEEARRFGGAVGTPGLLRTPEQATIGIFWAYDGARNIGTAPRLYNQCLRSVSIASALTTAQNAVLFAAANMAMADAAIATWAEKFRFHVARPAIAVREAVPGFGPGNGCAPRTFAPGELPLPIPADEPAEIAAWLATQPLRPTTVGAGYSGDPEWKPLGAPQTNARCVFHRTPNSPSYPSAHAAFGAACFGVAYEFLRSVGPGGADPDHLTFDFVSDEFDGRAIDPDGSVRVRHCRQLTLAQAIHENALSRIYLGLHWRMDAVEGVRLGCDVIKTLLAEGRGPASALQGARRSAKAGMTMPARSRDAFGGSATMIRRIAGRRER